jgi:tetratricopeptide (TPR) repeat protein
VRAAEAAQEGEAKTDALEHALELDPENELASSRLRESLVRAGQLERLAELLARAANACTKGARAAQLWREVASLYASGQGNLAGAIHALQRALKLVPDEASTMLELAKVYRRDSQWSAAAQLLARVLECTGAPDLLLKAHTELAALYEHHLNDPKQAIAHLEAAVKLRPDDVLLLQRLSELLSRQGEHAEAIALGQKLVQLCRTPDARVGALLHLSRVEMRRGERSAVGRPLTEAVALDGPLGGAGAAMREAIGTWVEWRDYAAAIRKHLENQPEGHSPSIDVYLELARVQREMLDDRTAALDTLQQALTRSPQNLALRAKYAEVLREANAFDACVSELRSLLAMDIERIQTWQDLATTFEAMKRPDARARVDDVLHVLGYGARPNKGAERASGIARRIGALPKATLDALARDLMPMGVQGDLLYSLAEALDKLYPPDLERYGVTSRDRVTARSGQPLYGLAEHIAANVGAPAFELYVHRSRTRGAGIELSNIPLIIVPAWLLEQSEAHQVFVLTRLLWLCARRCHALVKLTPRELEVLFAAYARTVSPSFGRGLTSEELLDDQSRRLHRALSRRARKSAEGAVQRYVAEEDVDLVRWVDHRLLEATRVAALACDDLQAALTCLSRLRGEPRDAALDTNDAVTHDLLRFWVSDPALRASAWEPSATSATTA